ncbi:MAG: hypothetical protein WCO00_11515 [Rhodospirillaceae bacterium]
MTGIAWIAAYPKSGSTWLQLALESVSSGGAACSINGPHPLIGHAASRARLDAELDIESSDLTAAEEASARPRLYERLAQNRTAPLFLKVHDAWQRTPAG